MKFYSWIILEGYVESLFYADVLIIVLAIKPYKKQLYNFVYILLCDINSSLGFLEMVNGDVHLLQGYAMLKRNFLM